MFGRNHLIWLSIAILVIFVMLFLNKKYRFTLKTNLTIMTVALLISETVKTLSGIMYVENSAGYYLSPGCLPFHLCSIQIFFVLYLRFVCKNESIKEKLLGLMYPTMLLGGTLALLIPTVGTSFSDIGPYQYFGYHIFLIYFSISIIVNKEIKIDYQTIGRNLIYMVVLMVFGLWINSALSVYDVNFMFLANPPMENLPVLNLNHGWYIYFTHLLMVGVILLILVQLPFALKRKRNRSPFVDEICRHHGDERQKMENHVWKREEKLV